MPSDRAVVLRWPAELPLQGQSQAALLLTRPVLKATVFLPKDVCGNTMCVMCRDGGRSSSFKSIVIVQYTVGGKKNLSF